MSKEAITKIKDAEEQSAALIKAAHKNRKDGASLAVAEGEAMCERAKAEGEKLVTEAEKAVAEMISKRTEEARKESARSTRNILLCAEASLDSATQYIIRSVIG